MDIQGTSKNNIQNNNCTSIGSTIETLPNSKTEDLFLLTVHEKKTNELK